MARAWVPIMFFSTKRTWRLRAQPRTCGFATCLIPTISKKYKLATTYLEAPVELRFRFNPDNDRRSVKLAVGAKVGTLVNAHTKAKELQNRQGATLNDYKVKEFGKRYFNSTRIALTGRIGFGHFSLFGTYSATTLFKEGVGPAVRPLTFGLTISGL